MVVLWPPCLGRPGPTTGAPKGRPDVGIGASTYRQTSATAAVAATAVVRTRPAARVGASTCRKTRTTAAAAPTAAQKARSAWAGCAKAAFGPVPKMQIAKTFLARLTAAVVVFASTSWMTRTAVLVATPARKVRIAVLHSTLTKLRGKLRLTPFVVEIVSSVLVTIRGLYQEPRARNTL